MRHLSINQRFNANFRAPRRSAPVGCIMMTVVVALASGQRVTAEKLSWSANRAANSSFEGLFENWNVRIGARNDGPKKEATVEIDTSESHSGVHSLKMSGDHETTLWHAVESEPIPITPGKRYRFSTWSKGQDIEQDTRQYHNCNAYVQFRDNTGKIIPLGISPLRTTYASRGTFGWTESFAMVVAPEGATQARLGVTLTCSGTVWFDDVELKESDDYAWAKRVSDGIAWYFTQGDQELAGGFEAADSFLRRVKFLLDIKHDDRIQYYKYKSRDQKEEITDDAASSHVDGHTIHSVSWDERQDMVHILAQELGPSNLVFAEGLAIYMTAAAEERDVHTACREFVRHRNLISIPTFLDSSTLTIAPQQVKEAVFGSFVGYVIQRYGIDKFKELYSYATRDDMVKQVSDRCEKVLGKSLEAIQEDWVQFLQGGKPMPERVKED